MQVQELNPLPSTLNPKRIGNTNIKVQKKQWRNCRGAAAAAGRRHKAVSAAEGDPNPKELQRETQTLNPKP
jgi:hypothetical protein